MMESNLDFTDEVIERVLELSADAQIARRSTAEGSLTFHDLTGAIKAYGKMLALLTALQRREEFYTIVIELGLTEGVSEHVN
jgi:hypothetical protein